MMTNPVSSDQFGLPADTRKKINSVFATHENIENVIIYGSRAMGKFRDGSDIDLTIKGRNLDHNILSCVIRETEALNLPYLFDISIYDLVDNYDLCAHIDRVGKVFYSRSMEQKF